MGKYDTVIFDLDGTLLNTLTDLTVAVNYVMRKYGFPEHSEAAVRSFVGNGVLRLFECAVPGGRSNAQFEACVADYRVYYESHSMVHTKPYEGIPALLSTLRARGYRLAVVSNKQDAAVKILCAGIFPEIPVAMGEMESRGIRRKPNPDMVLEAIRALGSEKSRCCYIGDSDVDILTAANTGIDCISVSWGFRDVDFLKSNGASQIASSSAELLQLLEK